MTFSSILSNFTKLSAIVIFLSYIMYFSNDRDYINYDGVPYATAAYLLKDNNTDNAHEYVWMQLEKIAPPEIYKDLCCGNYYKKSMSTNTEAFFSHLPAYSSKSGYIFLIRKTSDLLKTDEFEAMKIITQASIILIILIASAAFYNQNTLIFLSIFPVLILAQILELSRLLAPDALIALVYLVSAILLLKNKINFGLGLMMISILLRQNNIVFFGMSTLLLLKKRNFISYVAWCAAGLSLYFYNSYLFEGLGYWKSFHSTLIYLPSTFINYDPPFSISIYFTLLVDKFLWMTTHMELNRFIAIITFNSLISSYFLISHKSFKSYEIALAAIFSFGAIVSYLMFPIPDQRLYSGAVIVSSLALLRAIAKTKKS